MKLNKEMKKFKSYYKIKKVNMIDWNMKFKSLNVYKDQVLRINKNHQMKENNWPTKQKFYNSNQKKQKI